MRLMASIWLGCVWLLAGNLAVVSAEATKKKRAAKGSPAPAAAAASTSAATNSNPASTSSSPLAAAVALQAATAPTAEQLAFFEKRIRPVLVENCYECHSPETKTKGGLRLDTREGWAMGGDSGPALIAGDVEQSRLITAVRYRDKEFRMPPKKKLSDEQVADLEKWVAMGAPDPRAGGGVAKKSAINIEEGRKFWAYQAPKRVASPKVENAAWPRNEVDRFILGKLEGKDLQPVADADRVTLIRRVYFDLIGLPPTPAQVDAFVNDASPDAYGKVVDGLLASPHFGERWGRHWLDVARYAESLTLRGFVLKEAWRYRDYVIEAFNSDRPYDRFVREQIAGDQLAYADAAEQRRARIATAFLALGNTNLEEQDKKQLDMDVVDEQLDTLGKAFLAQTIGCARCHDHKFDPIPTRDYYALAGILKSVVTLEHSNVSKWIETPLPVDAADEPMYAQQEAAVGALEEQIKAMKSLVDAKAAKAAKAENPNPKHPAVIAATSLAGVVVDDAQAKVVGEWKHSVFGRHYVGEGYLHDINEGKGTKTLTFVPEKLKAGRYEVRLAYVPEKNRAENVPVTVFSADGEKTITLDQREEPAIDGLFVSLGQYRFEPNGQGFVLVSTEGTDGYVNADAVQFIPVELLDAPTLAKAATTTTTGKDKAKDKDAAVELKRLEVDMKKLQENGPKRPLALGVKEGTNVIGDIAIHIRGSVHNQGEVVPRGFLQVASHGPAPVIGAHESGRRELADWLASRENPLTARVMANRAWHWLFGAGIVRTTDNFGTTGELPSHPELLDYLALQLMDQGWSVKKLVRELVMSHTYQLASADDDAGLKADPENRLLWRMNRRRMDAEELRDTILTVSGQLQLDRGGPTIKPNTAADYGYKHTELRRSVYAPVLRNVMLDALEVFDVADPSMVSGRRNTSTVAPQALYLMNHPFVMEQSQQAARRLLNETFADDRARVTEAFRLVLGRVPTDGEMQVAMRHFTNPTIGENTDSERVEQWTQFIQALFGSIDFRYLK